MSAEDYEEQRLYVDNITEEIARKFHGACSVVGVKRGLAPLAAWEDLAEPLRETIKESVWLLVANQLIVPYGEFNALKLQMNEIKVTWGKLNDLMGGTR